MPVLPNNLTNVQQSDLIGQDSWFFFASFNIQYEILSVPVSEWGPMAYYKRIKASLASLAVTNDSAERAVKLTHDKLALLYWKKGFRKLLK